MVFTLQAQGTLQASEENRNSPLKLLCCMAKDRKAKHKKEKDKKRKRDDQDHAKQAEKARKLVKAHELDSCAVK